MSAYEDPALDPIPPGHGEGQPTTPREPVPPGTPAWRPAPLEPIDEVGGLGVERTIPHCPRCWGYHPPEEGCHRA